MLISRSPILSNMYFKETLSRSMIFFIVLMIPCRLVWKCADLIDSTFLLSALKDRDKVLKEYDKTWKEYDNTSKNFRPNLMTKKGFIRDTQTRLLLFQFF